MKLSRRAQRRKRHYQRMHKPGRLNLVALMDIFTILVFFLMVNSSDVKILQHERDVTLPESSADAQPEEALQVTIAGGSVLLEGRPVAEIPAGGWDMDEQVEGLQAALLAHLQRRSIVVPPEGLPLTLVADRDLDYRILRQVMRTCVEAGFGQLNLAVEQSAGEVDRG